MFYKVALKFLFGNPVPLHSDYLLRLRSLRSPIALYGRHLKSHRA